MKIQFPGYYRPSEEEFAALWRNCLFALDANVLLNLYGYSEATREQLVALLEKISDRLRVPHRFALEYQRNRCRAIMEQVKNYARVEKVLNDIFEKDFAPKRKHPFLDAKMSRAFNRLRTALRESREKHEALFQDDPYFARVTAALGGRVGPVPSEESLEKLHKEAARRYSLRIPPGYADEKEKGQPEAFGDYVGWSQILEIGKADARSIILITDDAKEDWWLLEGDKTIGPRPELLSEFMRECNQGFYMYSSDQFLKYGQIYLAQPAERRAIERAIEEVRGRLRDQFRQISDVKPTGETNLKPTLQAPEESLKPESASAREVSGMAESASPKLSPSDGKVPTEETE